MKELIKLIHSPSFHHRESLLAVLQPLAGFIIQVAVASTALLLRQDCVYPLPPLRFRQAEVGEVLGALATGAPLPANLVHLHTLALGVILQLYQPGLCPLIVDVDRHIEILLHDLHSVVLRLAQVTQFTAAGELAASMEERGTRKILDISFLTHVDKLLSWYPASALFADLRKMLLGKFRG